MAVWCLQHQYSLAKSDCFLGSPICEANHPYKFDIFRLFVQTKRLHLSLPPWGRGTVATVDEEIEFRTVQTASTSSVTRDFASQNISLRERDCHLPHGGRLKNAPFCLQKRRSPHPSCLRQSTFSAGEGLNVAALSAQGNEIYQTCRGRRPDLLRKLTTRDRWNNGANKMATYNLGRGGACSSRQYRFIFCKNSLLPTRVVEDVDPYGFSENIACI